MTRPVLAAVRQAVLGGLLVALSVPPLFALSRALGTGTPALESLALTGGSAVLGFAGGGALGGLLASSPWGVRLRRLRATATLAGLALGIVLCGAVLPVYLDSATDEVTDAATEAAAGRAGAVLDRPSSAWDQAGGAAGELARAGAARLPALALLGWTVLGPALAAGIEARRPRRITAEVTRSARGQAGR